MKSPDNLNERDFELINIVGGQLAANQRDLSRQMNLSLGMTNMLIRRLISKGYIRISQLDKRKVQYLLTPKGFAEKMSKSLNYTRKTIHSIALVRSRISVLLKGLYEEGIKEFYILGGSDLAGLIEMTMKEELPVGIKSFRITEMPMDSRGGVILICREDNLPGEGKVRTINVIEELAKDEELFKKSVSLDTTG